MLCSSNVGYEEAHSMVGNRPNFHKLMHEAGWVIPSLTQRIITVEWLHQARLGAFYIPRRQEARDPPVTKPEPKKEDLIRAINEECVRLKFGSPVENTRPEQVDQAWLAKVLATLNYEHPLLHRNIILDVFKPQPQAELESLGILPPGIPQMTFKSRSRSASAKREASGTRSVQNSDIKSPPVQQFGLNLTNQKAQTPQKLPGTSLRQMDQDMAISAGLMSDDFLHFHNFENRTKQIEKTNKEAASKPKNKSALGKGKPRNTIRYDDKDDTVWSEDEEDDDDEDYEPKKKITSKRKPPASKAKPATQQIKSLISKNKTKVSNANMLQQQARIKDNGDRISNKAQSKGSDRNRSSQQCQYASPPFKGERNIPNFLNEDLAIFEREDDMVMQDDAFDIRQPQEQIPAPLTVERVLTRQSPYYLIPDKNKELVQLVDQNDMQQSFVEAINGQQAAPLQVSDQDQPISMMNSNFIQGESLSQNHAPLDQQINSCIDIEYQNHQTYFGAQLNTNKDANRAPFRATGQPAGVSSNGRAIRSSYGRELYSNELQRSSQQHQQLVDSASRVGTKQRSQVFSSSKLGGGSILGGDAFEQRIPQQQVAHSIELASADLGRHLSSISISPTKQNQKLSEIYHQAILNDPPPNVPQEQWMTYVKKQRKVGTPNQLQQQHSADIVEGFPKDPVKLREGQIAGQDIHLSCYDKGLPALDLLNQFKKMTLKERTKRSFADGGSVSGSDQQSNHRPSEVQNIKELPGQQKWNSQQQLFNENMNSPTLLHQASLSNNVTGCSLAVESKALDRFGGQGIIGGISKINEEPYFQSRFAPHLIEKESQAPSIVRKQENPNKHLDGLKPFTGL